MTKIIKNAVVSFCSVTKQGGHKNGKHLLGIYVDKKFKKQFEKDFNEVWEDGKTAKAKKPVYDFNDWFSKEEDTKKLIFWVNAKADKERGIIFKNGKGCSFKPKDFAKIGTNSVIDLEFDIYYFNSSEHGEMVSRAIKAISLKDLVPYEGGSNLDGEIVEFDEFEEDAPVKEKKEKKKKKKKSKKEKK